MPKGAAPDSQLPGRRRGGGRGRAKRAESPDRGDPRREGDAVPEAEFLPRTVRKGMPRSVLWSSAC